MLLSVFSYIVKSVVNNLDLIVAMDVAMSSEEFSGIVLLASWPRCIGLRPMLCSLSCESSCNDIAMHHVAAVLV